MNDAIRVTFLGGAEEVGASCALLEIDDCRLLIDCGQRMGVEPGQHLPDFALLDAGEPLDAVLITHAHADHIGALPTFEHHLREACPIYGTEPTLALMKVMLRDAQRVMYMHRQGDGELPMSPPGGVSRTLQRLKEVRFGKPIHLSDKVRATWFPAGHILGAGMIEIHGQDKSIVFSGDVSVSEQIGVPGLFAPAIKTNVLVLESTYGHRLHAHRPGQERKIIETVKRTLSKGGHVLFPTFALGRAQEVLLLLGKAMRDGSLDPAPIYADGLVRSVSKVYSRFPDDLSLYCRRLWEQELDPIFPADLTIRPIRDNNERESLARGGACVVVASSGMLQGGASQFFAQQWVGSALNTIILTGYQDEESPGQALLDLASTPSDQQRYFKLGGVLTPINCRVENCQLSAHADNQELVALAAKLHPERILLVHGETTAREALARSLSACVSARVELPTNGERVEHAPGPNHPVGKTPAARPNPLGHWPPWDPQQPRPLDLAGFHRWLLEQDPPPRWLTIDELAEIWKSPVALTDADWRQLRQAVYELHQPYFVPDAHRPYVLHLTPLANLGLGPTVGPRLSAELATRAVRDLFPPGSGLVRFGFFPEAQELRLVFRFPLAARQRYVQRLRELQQRCGWRVQVNTVTQSTPLVKLAQHLLGQTSILASVDHVERIVEVERPAEFEPETWADLQDRFLHKTGYQLQ